MCVHVPADKYQNFKTDVQEGIGEVAGVLFRVAKYAYEKFHIHDLVVSLVTAASAAAVETCAGCKVPHPRLDGEPSDSSISSSS
jgi:hypothetical protein